MTNDELTRIAFDAAPMGLVMTEYRVIVECNDTFCNLSKYSRRELLGQSFRMLYANEAEFEAIRDIGVRALMDEGSYTDQRILRCKDGSVIWCRFRARTLTPQEPMARTVLSYAKLSDTQPPQALSGREREVVMGMTQGLTSKQIAMHLGLSARTVEDVRARLLRKFGVRNSTELLWRFTNVEV